MAHFAKLDENNIVLDVHVVNNEDILDENGNESEEVGIAFLTEWSGGYTNWKQTSYNGIFRLRYAVIGGAYDPTRDAFTPPRPYLSWVFNTETLDWDPPIPYPDNENAYYWDESTRQWVEVTE